MLTEKDIIHFNNDGQMHGYQEWYSESDKIMLRGNSKNGLDIGYLEWHVSNNTNFYII